MNSIATLILLVSEDENLQRDSYVVELCSKASSELEELEARDFWLNCLENAGVDNWEGIEYAFELKEEYSKEDK